MSCEVEPSGKPQSPVACDCAEQLVDAGEGCANCTMDEVAAVPPLDDAMMFEAAASPREQPLDGGGVRAARGEIAALAASIALGIMRGVFDSVDVIVFLNYLVRSKVLRSLFRQCLVLNLMLFASVWLASEVVVPILAAAAGRRPLSHSTVENSSGDRPGTLRAALHVAQQVGRGELKHSQVPASVGERILIELWNSLFDVLWVVPMYVITQIFGVKWYAELYQEAALEKRRSKVSSEHGRLERHAHANTDAPLAPSVAVNSAKSRGGRRWAARAVGAITAVASALGAPGHLAPSWIGAIAPRDPGESAAPDATSQSAQGARHVRKRRSEAPQDISSFFRSMSETIVKGCVSSIYAVLAVLIGVALPLRGIGVIVSTLMNCWLYAFYCFDYRLSSQYYTVEEPRRMRLGAPMPTGARVRHELTRRVRRKLPLSGELELFESNWPYYLGYGLLHTLLTGYLRSDAVQLSWFAVAAVSSVVFGMNVVIVVEAMPGPSLPYSHWRLPVFSPLYTLFCKGLMIYARRPEGGGRKP